MTATEFAAMIKAAKVTGLGETELQTYLNAEFGQGFCPSRRSIDILSDGHVEVKQSCIDFTFEVQRRRLWLRNHHVSCLFL
jgi:hypothetical protein